MRGLSESGRRAIGAAGGVLSLLSLVVEFRKKERKDVGETNHFFHRFDGSIILKISEGDNLGDNDGFSMI